MRKGFDYIWFVSFGLQNLGKTRLFGGQFATQVNLPQDRSDNKTSLGQIFYVDSGLPPAALPEIWTLK